MTKAAGSGGGGGSEVEVEVANVYGTDQVAGVWVEGWVEVRSVRNDQAREQITDSVISDYDA